MFLLQLKLKPITNSVYFSDDNIKYQFVKGIPPGY